MSQDNTKKRRSFSSIIKGAIDTVAEVELNPVRAYQDYQEEQAKKPKPQGVQDAQKQVEMAKAQLERAKANASIPKKAAGVKDQIKGLANHVRDLGYESSYALLMDLLPMVDKAIELDEEDIAEQEA